MNKYEDLRDYFSDSDLRDHLSDSSDPSLWSDEDLLESSDDLDDDILENSLDDYELGKPKIKV